MPGTPGTGLRGVGRQVAVAGLGSHKPLFPLHDSPLERPQPPFFNGTRLEVKLSSLHPKEWGRAAQPSQTFQPH